MFPSHRIDTVHITTDVIISTVLTHFKPMFHFYTPGKHQKIGGFLIFSGGREDFSNKNFLCVVSNLTNTLNQFEKKESHQPKYLEAVLFN